MVPPGHRAVLLGVLGGSLLFLLLFLIASSSKLLPRVGCRGAAPGGQTTAVSGEELPPSELQWAQPSACCHSSHFTDKESEEQRDEVTPPRAKSKGRAVPE